jgi:hypothetical protein
MSDTQIIVTVGETQQVDRADGNGPQPYAILSLLIPAAEAEALAAARIARAGSDLLAADAKPTAHAVADALVAAGVGS